MKTLSMSVALLVCGSALADPIRPIPIPHPFPHPLPLPLPSEMRFEPSLVKIFDAMEVTNNCGRGGLGSDAAFRGAQGITGFDEFHNDCGAHIYHEFRTGVAFASITGSLFPMDVEILTATLFFRLRENGTAPGSFGLAHTAEGRARAQCRIDLFLGAGDWSGASPDALPRMGSFVANAPSVGAQNGLFRIDITEKFKDLYFRRIPNAGFLLRGSTPDIISDADAQCTSLLDSFSIRVAYRAPE